MLCVCYRLMVMWCKVVMKAHDLILLVFCFEMFYLKVMCKVYCIIVGYQWWQLYMSHMTNDTTSSVYTHYASICTLLSRVHIIIWFCIIISYYIHVVCVCVTDLLQINGIIICHVVYDKKVMKVHDLILVFFVLKCYN